jgi:hypothetical protein
VPDRYNDYLMSDGIDYVTIIVEPEVIHCLTFVILAASQLLNLCSYVVRGTKGMVIVITQCHSWNC